MTYQEMPPQEAAKIGDVRQNPKKRRGPEIKIPSVVSLILVSQILASTAVGQMPKQIVQYVRTHYPKSTFPTHSQFSTYWAYVAIKDADSDPWFVIADFTGDGSTDFAVMIVDSLETKYLAIHSDDDKLSHIEFFPPHKIANLQTLNTCILLEPPGIIKETAAGPGNRTPKKLKTILPGIQVIFFEQSSIYIYWSNDHYEQLWTSD